jgi:hypothetical protein
MVSYAVMSLNLQQSTTGHIGHLTDSKRENPSLAPSAITGFHVTLGKSSTISLQI